MNYEKELSNIPFYKIHPEYKPFIGEKYDAFRILLIGESHFIGQTPDNERLPLSYFQENWWSGDCNELHKAYRDGYYVTRNVINNYKTGNRTKAHGIFTNSIKSFSDVVLGESVQRISVEESQKIEYFAFMNFFQMPSLYKGMKFWDSLEKSAGADKGRASSVWWDTVRESSKTLDEVIDVLRPNLAVFVSKSAGDAYQSEKSNARHSSDPNVVVVSHPGCRWWNERKADGLCGRVKFENYLREFIVNKKA